ncbi:hypothetical protein [Paraferrimonas sp. SM1919]|uniref:hypothetical protein n=1 Tax=Paraferrimonas sp. SM1919 TaxID=2662263 RepID=UPI0013D586C0|nr:hypothetical protein [Paraferrimonas sp. SM1919]
MPLQFQGDTIAVVGQGQWVNTNQDPKFDFLASKNISKIFVIQGSESEPIVITNHKPALRKKMQLQTAAT